MVVCHKAQYLALSSLIFPLMTFSAYLLLVIVVAALILILYMLIAEISIKLIKCEMKTLFSDQNRNQNIFKEHCLKVKFLPVLIQQWEPLKEVIFV